MTADVMDEFISYGVFAWDVHDSLWLLECGTVPALEMDSLKRAEIDKLLAEDGKPPVVILQDIIERDFLGHSVILCLLDAGGHKGELVDHFVKSNWERCIQQKGHSLQGGAHFKMSDKFRTNHFITGNARYYQSTAIYYLYAQKNREENYLWFYPEISEEMLTQIRAMQPDNSSKNGHLYENWTSKNLPDHIFDVAKYAFMAKDFMLAYYKNDKFSHCAAPSLRRRMDKIKTEKN